ncbi:MAG: sugar phosphate nucleotidyltransferase, partial [Nitrososphaerota archaeon]
MKGVILAAGRGKRLNPLTSRRPKHLLPIIDKPLIRKVVEAVAETGINDICIVVGYGSEKIIEALKNFTKINITFAVQ